MDVIPSRVILASTGMVRIPPAKGGAVEAYVHDLASMITENHIPVTVVSGVRDGPESYPWRVVEVPSPFDTFPLSAPASAVAHAVGGIATAAMCYRELINLGDSRQAILHLNEEVSGAMLCRILPQVKKVFTLHNPPPSWGFPTSGLVESGLRHFGNSLSRRFISQRADALFALTDHVRQYLVDDWGVNPAKVYVLPLPIDTGLFTPREHQDKVFELLYVGRLDERKGLPLLLKLAERLADGSRLTIIGRGPLLGPAVKAAESPQLKGRVRIIPELSAVELVQAYQQSDVFVFPSTLESYGRVILEAASCGLPVLLPDLPIFETFRRAGFVLPMVPDDIVSLEGTVESLRIDRPKRLSLGKKGREFVLGNNSYPVFSQRLLRAYGEVLG